MLNALNLILSICISVTAVLCGTAFALYLKLFTELGSEYAGVEKSVRDAADSSLHYKLDVALPDTGILLISAQFIIIILTLLSGSIFVGLNRFLKMVFDVTVFLAISFAVSLRYKAIEIPLETNIAITAALCVIAIMQAILLRVDKR